MTVEELTDKAHKAYDNYVSKFAFARDAKDFRVVCSTEERAWWLKARQQYIGASDAAAILGENPWSSPMDVYASKLGLDDVDHDVPEPAYWGLRLENILIDEFQRRTNLQAFPWGELIVSKERPWQAATIDGVVDPNGILEIKCTKLAWRWDEGLPPYVYAQVQHQLSVTGFQNAHVAVLFNGNEFYQKAVPRDEEYIEFLNEKEREFWDKLRAFEPPDTDSTQSCKDALAKIYPHDTGEQIVLSPEYAEIDMRLIGLKAELKDVQGDIRGLENKLRAAIGDATSALLTDGTVYTYKQQTRKEHVVPESEFRVLRRKGGRL